ncbi:YciI family protein [Pendulispora brunnea]|uniref:YciI family protein n=1 Tax=Pendulispora brunnea TaxID=2905690 RepID=A0ABZ2KGJ1_9BACT
MRYLCIYKPRKDQEIAAEPSEAEMIAMGKLIDEMTRAGVLLSTEGCAPSSEGARLQRFGGETIVTDGPFAEAKELVAGFCLIQVETKAEAVAWGRRFLEVVGEGESEILRLFEPTDFGGCRAIAPEAT